MSRTPPFRHPFIPEPLCRLQRQTRRATFGGRRGVGVVLTALAAPVLLCLRHLDSAESSRFEGFSFPAAAHFRSLHEGLQRQWLDDTGARDAFAGRSRSSSLADIDIHHHTSLRAEEASGSSTPIQNILGQDLEVCSTEPLTGWFRDGYCNTDRADAGAHLVCIQMTEDFLKYQQKIGNDLSTPAPMYGFPGLRPDNRWCVCASRWAEAAIAGVVAPVVAEATHEKALNFSPKEALLRYTVGSTSSS
eukprot:TRINITY_DN40411_c0_g1_i1.p1 TRINITY_DN40411_c0_g1~~TRINITY_DN40411_c0_g1_i1.p1  ORF type:complete len:270 (+),score=35.26 TRINITY_DN40411_c0_g1_i1:70-810(+)